MLSVLELPAVCVVWERDVCEAEAGEGRERR